MKTVRCAAPGPGAQKARKKKEAKEKAGLAEQLSNLHINFPVQANEEGRLYGSVTHQMVADAIEAACGEKFSRPCKFPRPN